MTSDAQHSSISKIKQKSFKPGVLEAKNYLIMNTKKCLKSGVVMLLHRNVSERTTLSPPFPGLKGTLGFLLPTVCAPLS